MQTRARLGTLPRVAIILVTTLLLAALLTSLALGFGAGPSPALVLPPPTGPARNGLVAYDSSGDIWVMKPDGSGRAQLTSGPSIDFSPMWSPDGTRLAYWSWADEPGGPTASDMPGALATLQQNREAVLAVIDLANHAPTPVLSGWFDAQASWAPDSRRLAAAFSDRSKRHMSVVSIDDARALDLGVDGQWPAWAPDDSLIAYMASGAVMGVSPRGGEAQRLTQTFGTVYAFAGSHWAPDSRRIVFYADGRGPSVGAYDIYVVDIGNASEGPVTNAPEDEYWPDWSPDGTRIAFSRVPTEAGGDNTPRFWIADAKGGNELELGDSLEVAGGAPMWSPDGTLIVAGSRTLRSRRPGICDSGYRRTTRPGRDHPSGAFHRLRELAAAGAVATAAQFENFP